MKRTIFYSWQSDLPNNTNRGFIQRALEDAGKALAADLDIEPVIERDTQGVPGSPDIARTIFGKIDEADVFVADVSLVTPKNARRPTPNPNVLIELGYALRSLGEARVILVFNRAFGKVEKLPFDLKMRRTLVYDVSEHSEDRAETRKKLASQLRDAVSSACRSTRPRRLPSTLRRRRSRRRRLTAFSRHAEPWSS